MGVRHLTSFHFCTQSEMRLSVASCAQFVVFGTVINRRMLIKITAFLAGSGSSFGTIYATIVAIGEVNDEGEQILDAIRNDTVG